MSSLIATEEDGIMNNREIKIFKDVSEACGFVVELWEAVAKKAIESNGTFRVALSGGKTPAKLYNRVAKDIDRGLWNDTDIFLVDERFVPLKHQDSNFWMIRENLLSKVNTVSEQVHLIQTENLTLSEAALAYEKDIYASFELSKGVLPDFDLIVLGIGKDGHIASLFPKSEALDVKNRLAVSLWFKNIEHERITLTLDVINCSKNIVFFVLGKEKADIIKEVVKDGKDYPASRINLKQGKVYFVLDKGSSFSLTC